MGIVTFVTDRDVPQVDPENLLRDMLKSLADTEHVRGRRKSMKRENRRAKSFLGNLGCMRSFAIEKGSVLFIDVNLQSVQCNCQTLIAPGLVQGFPVSRSQVLSVGSEMTNGSVRQNYG